MSVKLATTKSQRVAIVCSTCGSENILVDAWAEWDVESQSWVVAETFKTAVCGACNGECSVSEKELG